MDLLRLVESYQMIYNSYRYSPMKCIIYGKLKHLQWLHNNRYYMSLFDKDFCYCDKPYWMYFHSDIRPYNPSACGFCQYASTSSLLDFAKKEQQDHIVKWIKKLKYTTK